MPETVGTRAGWLSTGKFHGVFFLYKLTLGRDLVVGVASREGLAGTLWGVVLRRWHCPSRAPRVLRQGAVRPYGPTPCGLSLVCLCQCQCAALPSGWRGRAWGATVSRELTGLNGSSKVTDPQMMGRPGDPDS